MDLTGVLLRVGAARPHVLTVTTPGGTAVRLAAEEELRRRGWPAALTPADTDVLLVAGTGTDVLAEVLDEVWRAMPAPRVRGHATHPGDVAAVLDAARSALADGIGQRALAAAARPSAPARPDQGGHAGGESGGDEDHGMSGPEMPAGLPTAERGEDRDGLKLDQLHVFLGPVLPNWPAGLVLRLTVQGDVVQQAAVDAPGPGGETGSFWTDPWCRAAAGEPVSVGEAALRRVAAHLDSLGRLLAVAGWDDAAVAARRLRDETLSGGRSAAPRPAVERFSRRVARSRLLAWSTRGLGVLSPDDAVAAAVRGPALRAGGDVTARYRRWCSELAAAAAALDDDAPLDPAALEPPRGRLGSPGAPAAELLAVLPGLLEGAELAAVRLIVASLDPDLDELPARVEVSHGG